MDKKEYYRFPIFVNLEDKKVVIIGAGKIAIRRVQAFIKCGANILIIGKEISEEIYNINYDNIKIIKDNYNKKYLIDAFIVLATTNDKNINNIIYNDAKYQNILVNNASDKRKTDFYFPAMIYEDGFVVSICGNGNNHTLIKNIANKIRNFFRK